MEGKKKYLFARENGTKVNMKNIGRVITQYPVVISAIAFVLWYMAMPILPVVLCLAILLHLGLFVLFPIIEFKSCKPYSKKLFYVKNDTIYMTTSHKYHGLIKDVFGEDIDNILDYAEENDKKTLKINTHHFFTCKLLKTVLGRDVSEECKELEIGESVMINTGRGMAVIQYKGMLVNNCSRYKYKRFMNPKEFIETFRLYRFYTVEMYFN